jgi:hypothetical protein
MRHLIAKLAVVVALVTLAMSGAMAQEQNYTDPNVDYTLDFPNPTWRLIAKPDSIRSQAEFVYGDRLDGYLQIRKDSLEGEETLTDYSRRYRDQTLRFLPGYVDGKEERFAGSMNGIVFSYEYTQSGKSMLGRIYVLKADNRTIYALRFTGLRDKLGRIRNQTDAIARSFRLKKQS